MTLAPLINSVLDYNLTGRLVRDDVFILIIVLCRVCLLEELKKEGISRSYVYVGMLDGLARIP